jgi:hypothetical protein
VPDRIAQTSRSLSLLLVGGLIVVACEQPGASGSPDGSSAPGETRSTMPVETVFDEGPMDDVNSDKTPATSAVP